MSFRELTRRFGFLLDRQRRFDDLESEMRLHRELRIAKLQREGVANEQAVYLAERRFGNKTLIKEISADMWGWTWIDDAIKDLRYTVESCARTCCSPLSLC